MPLTEDEEAGGALPLRARDPLSGLSRKENPSFFFLLGLFVAWFLAMRIRSETLPCVTLRYSD